MLARQVLIGSQRMSCLASSSHGKQASWGCHSLAPRLRGDTFHLRHPRRPRPLTSLAGFKIPAICLLRLPIWSQPQWRPLHSARCAGTQANGQVPKSLFASCLKPEAHLSCATARRQVHGLYWNDIFKTLGPLTQGIFQQPLGVRTCYRINS